MTMKTPEQWLDENDPAWQDVCGEQPVLTKEIIAAIQSDARAEAESERDKAQDTVDNEWLDAIGTCYQKLTGQPWETRDGETASEGRVSNIGALFRLIEEARSERDKALACVAEMRTALEMWRCGTCGGTHKFTPECQGCLSGEGPCTCGQEEEQACPQCCAIDMPGLTKEYAALEHALSTDCGKDFVPRAIHASEVAEKAKEFQEVLKADLLADGWLSPEKAKEIERNAEILADDANGRCASAMRRANKFQAQVKLLVEALEFLMDMQNGPPLVKWEADWNKAMQQAKDALAAVKQP